MPSGSPEPPAAPRLSVPPGARARDEAFLLLPGLNLHPERLAPWRALLEGRGRAVCAPALTGFAVPGDPALRRVRAGQWLADVDAAWRAAAAEVPGARPSLVGYSLGALLGLAWSLEAGVPLRRAVLLAPALGLKPRHRALIALLGRLLPDALWLPSRAPRSYRFHGGTTVAAYRALATLQARLAPALAAWGRAAPETAPPPPLLIAYTPRDELIDTRLPPRLQAAHPARVALHTLRHAPRPGFPAHLGVDAHTLGEAEWARLARAVAQWLAQPGP